MLGIVIDYNDAHNSRLPQYDGQQCLKTRVSLLTKRETR